METVKPFYRRRIDGIDISYVDCSGHVFARHAHDEFVISANCVGGEAIWLDRKSLEAGPNHVTLYNPGQLQAGHGHAAPWTIMSFHVEPAVLPRIFGLSAETVFDTPVLYHPRLATTLRNVGGYSLSPDVSDDQALEAITRVLARLLASVGSHPRSASRSVPSRVGRIRERLLAEADDPQSLLELAAGEDMTQVQVVRAFSRTYGLPPFAWLMVERLKQARSRLEREEPIAQISMELGFSDQAHFTRRFKAMYGVPPGVWRGG